MEDSLQQAAAAIKAGNKAQARRLLKPILKAHQTAEGWTLAARAMETDEQAISCLKRALELDPWHTQANRMLLKLEDVKPISQREYPAVAQPAPQIRETQPLPELKRNIRTSEFQKQQARKKVRRRFGCVMLLLLQMSCSMLTLSLIGMAPGVIGTVTRVPGGPPPVTEIDGVDIKDIPDAVVVVPPAQSKQATAQNIDVLDHGYNHEYTFDARSGDEVVGYVQFLSLGAGNVNQNVVILRPDDIPASADTCMYLGRQGLLGGEGNVTFQCAINVTGTWKVRILGVSGQSVGAYFVGVETLR